MRKAAPLQTPEPTTEKAARLRTGGQILVDELLVHGVSDVFCVPGESYLAALDAMYGTPIAVTICRQEGGAAMMAEACGKLTGKPGICFVTRGPGATNAAPGVHIAAQDSTPMILFIGQVERGMRGREAFQEMDYRAFFGPIAKWVVEIDDPARIPELVSRAFHMATSGRPGPVVVALPEDVLTAMASPAEGRPYQVPEPAASPQDMACVLGLLAGAKAPLIIAGGARWDQGSVDNLAAFAAAAAVPVAVSFRRQSLFSSDHPNYCGDIGIGSNPDLVAFAQGCDVILLLGGRLSELPSQGYSLLDIPAPRQKLIHVHPGSDELGRVYRADVAINVSPKAFTAALAGHLPPLPVVDFGAVDGGAGRAVDGGAGRAGHVAAARALYLGWNSTATTVPGDFNLGEVICALREDLPDDAIICNGAGNYAVWVHRFHRFRGFGTQVAPTSGSMGYGVPAAVAAKRLAPQKMVLAFAGDGCFLMNGQEFATAVQYDLPIVVVIIDNGMYGTIRMHQERSYPGRVIATDLRNPDFAALAHAFGGHGERVTRTADFMPAFRRAVASGKPAIIHCITDPEALTPSRTLGRIRQDALDAATGR